jgi:hypothetical protein
MHRRGIATDRAELAQEIDAVNAELVTASTATEAAAEPAQTPELAAALIMLRQTFRGSTAPRPGLSKLFRRLAHAITVRIWRVMPVPRRPSTITPIIESRVPT